MVLSYLHASPADQVAPEEKTTVAYLKSWARDGTFEIIEDAEGWVSAGQIIRYATWLRDVSDERWEDRFPVTFSLN